MDFQTARNNMVMQQVRPWQVHDARVLEVMDSIPREYFVPLDYRPLAYTDTDIPLSHGQSLLPPKVVGRALQALEVQPHHSVLEIGTGTGYVTACLASLSAKVLSVEIQPRLLQEAHLTLDALRYRTVKLYEGDAAMGWKQGGPYDVIFVTGSYPTGLPSTITEDLKPGGRLFAFIGVAPAMQAIMVTREDKNYKTSYLFETLVPALSQVPQPALFTW